MIFSTFAIPILLLLLFLCLQSFSLARADEHPSFNPSFLWNVCSSPTFQTNGHNVELAALLTSLHLHSSSSLYHFNSTSSASPDTIYAMFQCRGDLTSLQCSHCVSSAINTSAQKCPGAVKSRIYLDACSLIYQNERPITEDFGMVFYMWNTNNDTDATFRSNRDEVLATVSEAAPSHGGYYTSYAGKSISEGVYALAQCNGYLSQPDCLKCLSRVTNVQRLIGNQVGGRVYFGSCYYRFETYLFYTETPVTLDVIRIS